jgi:hypothetical protein
LVDGFLPFSFNCNQMLEIFRIFVCKIKFFLYTLPSWFVCYVCWLIGSELLQQYTTLLCLDEFLISNKKAGDEEYTSSLPILAAADDQFRSGVNKITT